MDNFEEHYARAILATVRKPIIVLDKEMKVKSANAPFYSFFGTTKQETEGMPVYGLNPRPERFKELEEKLQGLLNNRAKVEDYELKVFSPKMGERTMLVNAGLIDNGSTTGRLILIELDDITAISTANAKLLQNNRELEENNKELLSFSYIASHDLQEPVRKIYTFSKIVLDNAENHLSQEGKMCMERIMVSTNRMQQLIDGLLAYSHINNPDGIEFGDVDLALVVSEVINDLNETITAKNAQIQLSPLPVVKGINMLLHQLFINLLGNSLKYSRADAPPEIKLSYETIKGHETVGMGGDAGTNYYKIKVQDNGIGFRREQAQIIFELFKRLHSKDKYEGSGIGLAICSRIAAKHNGFINAESVPGAGTTFNIYLPV